MKILIVTLRVPYPPKDGGAIAMYQVIQSLALAGHQLTLAMLNTKKHFADPAALKTYSSSLYAYTIDTTPRLSMAFKSFLWGKIPYNIERFFHPGFEKLLVEILTQNHFDIIHLEGTYLSTYAPLIKKQTQAPLVLRAHNIEYEIWQRLAKVTPFYWPPKWYYYYLAQKGKKFEKQYIHFFDGIIPITQKDAAAFQKLGYTKPLRVIPACVSIPSPKTPLEESPTIERSCCFLGSLDWRANQQGLYWFLKKVWKNLATQGEFHIAGRNLPESLKELRAPRVFVHGEIPDALAFLRRYTLVIIPLFAGSGMRIKIIEAMSIGKCVISTSLGLEGIEGKDGVHFVVANTPNEFIEKIVYYWQHPQERQKIELQAQNLVASNYNCNQLAKLFEQFYQTLL
ncbi:MAG: glycosyltransferase family 4 protein [Bacteroidia bacterium]|nr:glycosyltransferase family 4 protein [Bacteroidia bacterium]MDW8159470.1 glycosyltransferase family 4 protein [Bacteroidia bacterium]